MIWQTLVICIELQGAFVFFLLGTGWWIIGNAKAAESKRRSQEATILPVKVWPGVSVILPLRGCRKHSISNWKTQLHQDYDGPMEYYLIVDSRDDTAYQEAEKLLKTLDRHVRAHLVLSGQCSSQSQKLCNIQAGIKAAQKENKFIVCVDDDVALHPSTIRESIAALTHDKEAFMLTGYPFDVPARSSGLLVYAALTYHLPLLIGFCLPETHFVWGGFMVFPTEALKGDWHGIMKAWSDGGYSDDLIVAAKCSEHKLKILSPSFAIFPQWMDEPMNWAQYWNYLRRQLYVMDTYCNDANRRLNHTMMALHPYLSMAFVVPASLVVAKLASTAACQVYKAVFETTLELHQDSKQRLPFMLAIIAAWPTVVFLLAFAYAVLSLRWMTGVMLQLFDRLSPGAEQHSLEDFHWIKMWLGLYMNNLLLPFCMAYTKLCPAVTWSGINYHKRNGKVVPIHKERAC